MQDLFYIAIMVLFFALARALALGCDALLRSQGGQ